MTSTPIEADASRSVQLTHGPWTVTLDERGQIGKLRSAVGAPAARTPLTVGTQLTLRPARKNDTTVTMRHQDGAPVASGRWETPTGIVDLDYGLFSGRGWGMLIVTAKCTSGDVLVHLHGGELVEGFAWGPAQVRHPALGEQSITMAAVADGPAVTLTTNGLGPLHHAGPLAHSAQHLEVGGRAYVVLWWGRGLPTVPTTWRKARALLAQARREWYLGGGAGRARQLLSRLTSPVEVVLWVLAGGRND